jgi:uncharacterized SAM-binding protein YcdF (DUF218 family)
MRGRRLWAIAALVIAVPAVVVVGFGADVLRYAAMSDNGPADAAIVLGAAVRTTGPSPVYVERINHAIELYRSGAVKYLIMTGGKGLGERMTEADAGRDRAIAAGVPSDAIFTETLSRDTRENLQNVKPIVDEHQFGRVLIVSDPLHMMRAMQMAAAAGLDAAPSPTPTSRYRTLGSQIPMLIRETYFNMHYRILGS